MAGSKALRFEVRRIRSLASSVTGAKQDMMKRQEKLVRPPAVLYLFILLSPPPPPAPSALLYLLKISDIPSQAFYSRLALVSKLTNLFGKKKHLLQAKYSEVSAATAASAEVVAAATSQEGASFHPVCSHFPRQALPNDPLQLQQRQP